MDHDEQCFKNQALRDLGVGGSLASCTCGLDALLRVARAAKEFIDDEIWFFEAFATPKTFSPLEEAIKALPEGLLDN